MYVSYCGNGTWLAECVVCREQFRSILFLRFSLAFCSAWDDDVEVVRHRNAAGSRDVSHRNAIQ